MERIEFLLLHAFHANNYILPDSSKIKNNIENSKFINKEFVHTLIICYNHLVLYSNMNMNH